MIEWNSYFSQLHVREGDQLKRSGALHIFTDGSCHNQQNQLLRFASWAVILASPDSLHDYHGSEVLARGPLPGLLQSAVRAEIYAVLCALQMVAEHKGAVTLWTDCDAVVKKFRRLLAGHEVSPNSAHGDLWQAISACLAVRTYSIEITKVAAHQDVTHAATALEEWCFRYNHLADKHAVQANYDRPPEFWELFERHRDAVAFTAHFNQLIWNVVLAVSQAVVREEQPLQVLVEPQESALPLPATNWRGLPPLSIPSKAVRWYGDRMVRLLLSWFWQSLDSSTHRVCWVSHFQLYVDYMCSTGHPGPVHVSQWRDGEEVTHLSLMGYSFRQRARWFTKMLKESLKHLGVSLHMGYGRPSSQAVQMHTGVLALPWDPLRLRLADKWMMTCSNQTFKRQTRAIDSLPIAGRRTDFPEVYVSSLGL